MRITRETTKEIIKSQKLSYYAANHGKIPTYNGPQFLGVEQQTTMLLLDHHKQLITIGDRNIGRTVGGLFAVYHYLSMNPDRTAICVSTNGGSRDANYNTMKAFDGDTYRPWWMASIQNSTRNKILYDNGSVVSFVSSKSLDHVRGMTINYTFLDDMDMWLVKDQQTFFDQLYPVTFMCKTQIAITINPLQISTPFQKLMRREDGKFVTVEI